MAELLPQDTDKDFVLAGRLSFGINNRKHLIQIPSSLSLKQKQQHKVEKLVHSEMILISETRSEREKDPICLFTSSSGKT